MVNFLKRKRTSLLYHNLKSREVQGRTVRAAAASAGSLSGVDVLNVTGLTKLDSPQNIRKQEQSCEKLKNKNLGIESIEKDKDFPADENDLSRNWDRAKEHIEKLLYEISDSMNSDDLSRQRVTAMTELLDGKANDPQDDENAGNNMPLKTYSVQNTNQNNRSSKLPLDIQELQAVSAMAKRLCANSKVKKSICS
ncbi:MAG: hypothetical protein JW787_16120 [Sedimentisphaerales bacterium]|nr:hypothetical protein [Sedimentisphaerales bacterium]